MPKAEYVAVDSEYLTAHNVGKFGHPLSPHGPFCEKLPFCAENSSNDIRGLAVSYILRCQVRICGYVVSRKAPPQPQGRQTF